MPQYSVHNKYRTAGASRPRRKNGFWIFIKYGRILLFYMFKYNDNDNIVINRKDNIVFMYLELNT